MIEACCRPHFIDIAVAAMMPVPNIVPPTSVINLALSFKVENSFNSDNKARHMNEFKRRKRIDVTKASVLFLKTKTVTKIANKVMAMGFKGELESQ